MFCLMQVMAFLSFNDCLKECGSLEQHSCMAYCCSYQPSKGHWLICTSGKCRTLGEHGAAPSGAAAIAATDYSNRIHNPRADQVRF
jgi:hypothetical protein